MMGAAGGFTGRGGGGAGVVYLTIGSNINNWNQVIANLRGLRISAQNEILANAVKPALAKIGDAAKSNVMALSTTGRHHRGVRSSIAAKTSTKIKSMSKSRGTFSGRLAVWYGQPRKNFDSKAAKMTQGQMASLAHLIEYGYTLTHYFGRRISPRKIAARPFMRPAFEQNVGEAQEMFKQAFLRGINRARSKAG